MTATIPAIPPQIWATAADVADLPALLDELDPADEFLPPTPVDCSVLIAGERVNDGRDPADMSPVILTGLQVVWGRSSTVDQPGASTCTFTVRDTSGTDTFTRLAALGQTVQVRASAITWDESTSIETMPDPGFDTATIGSRPDNVIVTRPTVTARVVDDTAGTGDDRALQVSATSPTTAATGVIIAPAAPSQQIDAWDDLPRTEAGQTWQIRVENGTAAYGVLQVGVATFTSPAAGAAATIDWIADWNPEQGAFEAGYDPPRTGVWLGVAVRAPISLMPWTDAPWASWTAVPPEVTWESLGGAWSVGYASLSVPGRGLTREVLVFAGRITDAGAFWDLTEGACLVNVTATDLSADLANRDVGAEPWGVQALAARVGRILASGEVDDQVDVVYGDGPANITDYQVTRMDVDRQQVWGMLDELISGVDGVLWLAVHLDTGPYILIEDMSGRQALLVLADDGNGYPHITTRSGESVGGTVISACRIDLDPVQWVQTTADIATRVVVYWLDQSTDPDPTQSSVEVRDSTMEAATARYGVRRVSVTSQLTSADDATDVANLVLARLSRSDGWRVTGVHWVVDDAITTGDVASVLDLLDGTRRIGRPVLLRDLPPWSPIGSAELGVYLEGGRYVYDDARWDLELLLSNSAGVGESVAWNELDPAWSWPDFAVHDLSWSDLIGVGPPSAALALTGGS